MRKGLRVLVLSILGLFSTAVLGVITTVVASVSLAATALIVPGTGTPSATDKPLYEAHAIDRYVTPFVPGCTFASCNPTSVDYPASFFPLAIFPGWCVPGRCETWNDSVGQGVTSLITNLQNTPDNDVTLFGYSQGGAVVSNAMRQLEGNPLFDKVKNVVMIGNAYNPDGGLFTRLGFLPTIPFLNITFGPATPVDTGKPMVGIGFQYDPVMYAPKYWGNPLSMLNALAAFETVHGYYLTPNENGPTDPIAYGYTETELAGVLDTPCPGPNCRVDSYGNKYYMIPAKGLPMYNFVLSQVPTALQPLVKPFVDLVQPVTTVLVDLGYDWSGDPGKTSYLSPLPFKLIQNWPGVGLNLVTATIQGIQAFLGDLGAVVPATAPTQPNISTLSVPNSADPSVEPQDEGGTNLQKQNVLASVDEQGKGAAAGDQPAAGIQPAGDIQPRHCPCRDPGRRRDPDGCRRRPERCR